MQRLQVLFDRFLRVRVYVNNITPATRSKSYPGGRGPAMRGSIMFSFVPAALPRPRC
jgi:hypothetical protein